MKAWKVFKQHEGKLLSASYYVQMRPHTFEYSLTEKNIPNPEFGPFFCFKTKKQAERFALDVENPVIRKVEIEPTENPVTSICFYTYEIADFWEKVHKGIDVVGYFRLIEGTIFADSLVILEE